jgi:hypothetical protein
MSVRHISFAAALLVLSSGAMAQQGSSEEQAACRPDVRRFCYKLKNGDGTDAFLQCLQEHRARLSGRCRAVLESHGV